MSHYTLLKDSHQEISMIGLHLLRARNTLYSLFVFKLYFFFNVLSKISQLSTLKNLQ